MTDGMFEIYVEMAETELYDESLRNKAAAMALALGIAGAGVGGKAAFDKINQRTMDALRANKHVELAIELPAKSFSDWQASRVVEANPMKTFVVKVDGGKVNAAGGKAAGGVFADFSSGVVYVSSPDITTMQLKTGAKESLKNQGMRVSELFNTSLTNPIDTDDATVRVGD